LVSPWLIDLYRTAKYIHFGLEFNILYYEIARAKIGGFIQFSSLVKVVSIISITIAIVEVMALLSSITAPTDGIVCQQEKTTACIGNSDLGSGRVFVAER